MSVAIPLTESPGPSSRGAPLPASMTVAEAREAYFAENAFTLASYDEKTTKAEVYGIPFAVPNTDLHRWALILHDLHHVATGFGTNLTGEGEISGWELGAGGMRSLGWVASLVIMGALMGLVVAPRRTYTAWKAGRKGRSLFREGADPERFLAMTLGELRAELGLPEEGLAALPRGLHWSAPKG
jgi:hypothetical protein